ncbi:AraC family transcriptional regulator [Deinococcus sp. Arct2-2]|uniref:AraC family transcriptional regulator n=1 Tax=Deinococcus sp. Arct2-2 TaxID=2568653 RepID=UPI0010A2D91D|nr:helix-turn-helix domain-containing protein [Deinococcus sp. Arct2-2]THF71976.1 AraC family transcriptional regulator [Deinococcus sp. Arct2-2]
MVYREILPDARLRPLVRAYWQVAEFHTVEEEEHRMMPEGLLRLIFYAGSSWQRSSLLGTLERLPEATLSGLTLAPQRMVSRGLALGVELYPWGARQLFGWKLASEQLDLSLDWPILTRTVCALLELGAWDEARHIVEDWLLKLWTERGREPSWSVKAAGQLYQSLGQSRLGRLAEEYEVSQRQLERLFLQDVGVNAKTLARLIRFEEVHNRLWRTPKASLAQLSYELGFADQAHLSRDFRAMTQMTPGAFAHMVQSTLTLPSRAQDESSRWLSSGFSNGSPSQTQDILLALPTLPPDMDVINGSDSV